MPRPKYTGEIVEVILAAIRSNGSDCAGFEAANLHKTTFYLWLKKYPEFAAAVALAKEEYRHLSPVELTRQAQKAFVDYLYGNVKEVWIDEVVIYDALGEIKERRVTTRTIQRGVPKWAIERQLGVCDWVDAIKTLIAVNILKPEAAQKIQELLDEQILTAIREILVKHLANDEFI